MTVKVIGHQWYWEYEIPIHQIQLQSTLFETLLSLIFSRKTSVILKNDTLYMLTPKLISFYYIYDYKQKLLLLLHYINISVVTILYFSDIFVKRICISYNIMLITFRNNTAFFSAYYTLSKWFINSLYYFSTNSFICLTYFCTLTYFSIEICWLVVYTSIRHPDDNEFPNYIIDTLWIVKPEWFYEDLFTHSINYNFLNFVHIYELPFYYPTLYPVNTNYIFNIFTNFGERTSIKRTYNQIRWITIGILFKQSFHNYIWFSKTDRILIRSIDYYIRLIIACDIRDRKKTKKLSFISANRYMYREIEFCLLPDNILDYERGIDVEQYITNRE